MHDRIEIEREMFRARQDLEETIDRLVHRVRERMAFRARATHAMQKVADRNPRLVTFGLIGLVLCGLLVQVLRRRRVA